MSDIVTLNGYKIKDEKAIRSYESVAQMKADTKLKEGYHVKTKGYYEANDGGHGEYVIVNDNTLIDDGGSIHVLSNGLRAKLYIQNNIINVKQFGAYGDNTHNDTQAFINAIALTKKLIIPTATYLLDYVNFIANSDVDGCNSVLNTSIPSTNLNSIGNNSIIKNLTINSTNENREWNRIDMTDKSNIIIDNCKFSGFRQITESGPNVWALYFRNSKNIRVTNCYFDNNSFEDIIIEYNCDNLYFNNLSSSNTSGVNIDIEPSTNNDLHNILFENCIINIFRATDYYYAGNNTNNITCINCIINGFKYHGGDLTFINCTVTNYDGLIISDTYFGGPIKIIQSANFSDNLIDDCYFNDISKTSGNSYWWISYNTGQWADMIRNIKDENGYAIVLNPSNTANNIILESPYITVESEKSYMLKTLTKSYFPNNSINPSTSVRITFYDNSNTQISRYLCSIDRHPLSTTSNYSEQNILFKTPENCTKLKIEYRNGQGSAPQSLYLKATGLYKISPNTYGQSNEPKPFVENTKRIITSDTLPTSNSINYNKGDLLYYKTPSTYVGAVCIDETGQGGTWSNFGAIES